MNKGILISVLVITSFCSPLISSEPQVKGTILELEKHISKLSYKYRNTVVNITAGNNNPSEKAKSWGSGIIVSTDGFVLTNYHVLYAQKSAKISKYINVHMQKGDTFVTYDADLLVKDEFEDLAVLKIEGPGEFVPAKLGDSDALKTGDFVLSMGYPFGYKLASSYGIVSAKQSFSYGNWKQSNLIQTDAAIYRGSSGGPLINMRGEVVGINTAMSMDKNAAGMNFAVPVNSAKQLLKEIGAKEKILRGGVSVEVMDVNASIISRFKSKYRGGVLVNRVFEKSSAEKGGLKRGDIIIKVAGRDIKGVYDFHKHIRQLVPGEKAEFLISRYGKDMPLNIKIKKFSDSERLFSPDASDLPDSGKEVKWQSITVIALDPDAARARSFDKGEAGVIVVMTDYSADNVNFGLIRGDLIREINGDKITDIEDFKKAVKKIKLSEGIVFDVIRYGYPVYIVY